MNAAGLTGGCVCGAVRYRLASAPFDAGYCHCETCRRSSGAPLLAFATVPEPDFVLIQGRPRVRRSSPFGERGFCGECGTQLTMHVDHQPDTIDFTLCSLDQPEVLAPGFHLFFGSRLPWFDVRDSSPRHARLRPDTPGLSRADTEHR